MKNFGEKEAWAYPGTAQFFSGTPYYLRNGKNYRFQIWPVHAEVHPNKSPLKIYFGEKEKYKISDDETLSVTCLSQRFVETVDKRVVIDFIKHIR